MTLPEMRPGQSILFMKVGTHAQEDLDDIVKRKRQEIDEAGFAMWGYGGSTCHPTTMVQPFAQAAQATGPIVLVMQPMASKHFATPLRAEAFSADGLTWKAIPAAINVLGSRYALCIKSLEQVDEQLDLSATQVALGNSRGRTGSAYVRGRVDKACLEITDPHDADSGSVVRIGLVAELSDPYAVFLRG